VADVVNEGYAVKYYRGLSLVAMQADSGSVQRFITNGHGDVTAVTNMAGTVQYSSTYDAFGVKLSGNIGGFGYCGEYYDKDILINIKHYTEMITLSLIQFHFRGSRPKP